MGHGVEDGNDLTDGVAARRDRYLFTIGIRLYIVRFHTVKQDLIE